MSTNLNGVLRTGEDYLQLLLRLCGAHDMTTAKKHDKELFWSLYRTIQTYRCAADEHECAKMHQNTNLQQDLKFLTSVLMLKHKNWLNLLIMAETQKFYKDSRMLLDHAIHNLLKYSKMPFRTSLIKIWQNCGKTALFTQLNLPLDSKDCLLDTWTLTKHLLCTKMEQKLTLHIVTAFVQQKSKRKCFALLHLGRDKCVQFFKQLDRARQQKLANMLDDVWMRLVHFYDVFYRMCPCWQICDRFLHFADFDLCTVVPRQYLLKAQQTLMQHWCNKKQI